jgi:hypothetical protein
MSYCRTTGSRSTPLLQSEFPPKERVEDRQQGGSRDAYRYAQAVNIRRGRSGHLWQARFYSSPLSPRHLWAALRYVEDNPCRAGLVNRPEEYRYSSAPVHLLGVKDRTRVSEGVSLT